MAPSVLRVRSGLAVLWSRDRCSWFECSCPLSDWSDFRNKLRVKEWLHRQRKKIPVWQRQQWLTPRNRNRRTHRWSKRMMSLKSLRLVRLEDQLWFFSFFSCVFSDMLFSPQNGTQKTKTKRTRNNGRMTGKTRSLMTLRISWGELWTETPFFPHPFYVILTTLLHTGPNSRSRSTEAIRTGEITLTTILEQHRGMQIVYLRAAQIKNHMRVLLFWD